MWVRFHKVWRQEASGDLVSDPTIWVDAVRPPLSRKQLQQRKRRPIILCQWLPHFCRTGPVQSHVQGVVCECFYRDVFSVQRVVTLTGSLQLTLSEEPRYGFCVIWSEPRWQTPTVGVSSTPRLWRFCETHLAKPPSARLWPNTGSKCQGHPWWAPLSFSELFNAWWLREGSDLYVQMLPNAATLDQGAWTHPSTTDYYNCL